MGTQDTLRNLLVAGAVFVLIMAVGPTLFPPAPLRPPTGPTLAPDSPDRSTETTPRPSSNAPAAERPFPTNDAAAKVVDPGFLAIEADTVTTFDMGASPEIETQDRTRPSDPYRMRLVLTNVGAAVESA